MNRAAALAYLGEQFGTLATELGMTATDDTAGYKAPIDTALRVVGTAEADLATAVIADDVARYLAALDYAALQHLWRKAAARVDISVGDPAVDKKRSQVFKQIGEMLKDARRAAEDAGVLTGTSTWTLGRFTLDFLEPALADQ